MNVRFPCPQCGKKLSAPATAIGRYVPCPNCGERLMIPDVATTPSPAAPVPPPFNGAPTATATKEEEPALMVPVNGHPEDLIDVTAMVDIVFFMLIFFLVTSLQSLEAVINLPSPEPESGASATVLPTDVMSDPSTIMVTIDEDDTVWVEDEEVFGEQNLRARLRAAKGDDRNGMLVIGDPDATHGTLVMVLDAGADAGLTELMFSVGEAPE